MDNSTEIDDVSVLSNGSSIEEYAESWTLGTAVPIVVPVLFGIIVIVGLIGNGLVVLVVACNAQMRSTTNLLIINLAIADLLFIIFCVPFTATDYALKVWPFGDVWCRIVQYLVFVLAYASVYTLVLMSLDRFLAVVLPIASMELRTENNACRAIGLMWLVIVIGCVPVGLSHGEVRHYVNSTHVSCMFLDSQLPQISASEGFSYPAFQTVFFATAYVLPLLITVALYLALVQRLWRGVESANGSNGNGSGGARRNTSGIVAGAVAVKGKGGQIRHHISAEGRRSKRRVTRLVVVVVVIFAVCWCPLQVILLLRSFNLYPVTDLTVLLQICAHVQAYMNSCVNPILYAFLSDNFRKAFYKIIHCSGVPAGSVPAGMAPRRSVATADPVGRRGTTAPDATEMKTLTTVATANAPTVVMVNTEEML